MSDYLWDRTGEPEPEVERLEALLADFRHAPRPLRLPAEVVPFGRRPSRLFSHARLAAAAALLLVTLAGAGAFLLRARVATGGKAAVASGTLRPLESARAGAEVKKGAVAVEPARAAAVAAKDDSAADKNLKRVSPVRKGAQLASLPRRQQKATVPERGGDVPSVGSAFQSMSAGGVAPTLVEGTRLMAKEQLVYALRLTGAKLRDVRLKSQGLDSKEAKQP